MPLARSLAQKLNAMTITDSAQKLEEIGKILASPELGIFLTNEGAEAEIMTPQQFGDMMRLETERWAKVALQRMLDLPGKSHRD